MGFPPERALGACWGGGEGGPAPAAAPEVRGGQPSAVTTRWGQRRGVKSAPRARCWVGAPGEVACVPRWRVTCKQLLMPLQGIEVRRVRGAGGKVDL